jgi:hypothetical protein
MKGAMISVLKDFLDSRNNPKGFYTYPLDPSPYGNILDHIASFDKIVVNFVARHIVEDDERIQTMIDILVSKSRQFHNQYNATIEKFEGLLYEWLNDGGHFSRDSDDEDG